MYQFKNTNPLTQVSRGAMGEVPTALSFDSTQREVNQMKTASQVQNYAATKLMTEQGRTDMRGNVAGYAETLA